jgi:PAS domain S-box-containing protein
MDEDFATCEMIFDSAGEPVDFRYLAVNPAFTKLTGLKDVVGRTVREMIPEIEPFWIETYGRIVRTGQGERILHTVASMGKHFDLFAWRMTPANAFAVVFNDVTDRKRAEDELKKRKKRLKRLSPPQGNFWPP